MSFTLFNHICWTIYKDDYHKYTTTAPLNICTILCPRFGAECIGQPWDPPNSLRFKPRTEYSLSTNETEQFDLSLFPANVLHISPKEQVPITNLMVYKYVVLVHRGVGYRSIVWVEPVLYTSQPSYSLWSTFFRFLYAPLTLLRTNNIQDCLSRFNWAYWETKTFWQERKVAYLMGGFINRQRDVILCVEIEHIEKMTWRYFALMRVEENLNRVCNWKILKRIQ